MTARPTAGDDWVALSADPLRLSDVAEWAVTPHCGAVATFAGTVRDHSEAGPGVTHLEYEAWEGEAVSSMAEVVAEARAKWPELGRLAVLHRTGRLDLGETAVVAAASAPHREEAFQAARYLIDETKSRAPIWKKELRADGGAWVGVPETVPADAPGAGRRK
jgi:molybdopterin synthase catalytic subunit